MIDSKAVGRTSAPTLHEVERGAIRRFAESIGDLNPIYFDAEHARASGFKAIAAPPAFPICFSAGADYRELLGVHGKNLILAEFTIEYDRAIVAGDKLLVSCRVTDFSERPSAAGRVEVAVIEEEGRDENGQIVYRARRTFIVRTTREV
jgi:acyl dehydratase